MKIGAPKEIAPGENRVAMTPDSAAQLQKLGHECLIVSGAGTAAGFSDAAYQAAGVGVVKTAADVFAGADVVAKVRPPSEGEAARLAHLVATAIIVIVGAVCLLGMIFAPQVVGVLASGWTSDPEKFALAVRLTRIMFPFLLLVALAAQAMGILNASGSFGVPAMASTWFNVGSVSLGALIGFVAGPHIGIAPIEGMAWGVVLGGMLQLLSQAPSLRKNGFRFRLAFDASHAGLRHIFRLMGPAIIGSAAVQVNVAVNQMDQVVQQNAAMVEEATAATHSLKAETAQLVSLVGRFRLGHASPRASARARPTETFAKSGVASAPRPLKIAVGQSFTPASDDGWEEF